MTNKKKRLFISYANEEAIVAKKIEDILRFIFDDKIEIFSSASGLKAGQKWFKRITDEAQKFDTLIVICSPFSLSKMWLAFEAGAAWSRDIDIIPICHSGTTRTQLPDPFRQYHSLEIRSKTFVEEFISAIATHFEFTDLPSYDNEYIAEGLKAAVYSVRDEVKPIDVFVSTPFSSFGVDHEKKAFLIELREVLKSLMTHSSLRNFHYCLNTIEDFSLDQPHFLASEISIQKLRQSKKFLMIVPYETLPSSCFVEAGIAIGLKIPSVYFVRSRKCLPNLLREVGGVNRADVSVDEFDSVAEVAAKLRGFGPQMWPNIHG
jgi:hypothetical protein